MRKEPMIRKQLYIKPAQDEFVKELAAKYSTSEGQIVRKAIDELFKGQFAAKDVDLCCWEEEVEFIRSRFDLKVTESDGKRRWTRDEIYER